MSTDRKRALAMLVAGLWLLASPSLSARFDCDTIRESNPVGKWLTLPHSRLVINPTLSQLDPLPASLMPSLPMSAAYYVNDRPARLPLLWAWVPGGRDAMRASVTRGPVVDVSSAASSQWTASGVEAQFSEQSVRLSLTGSHPYFNAGAIERQVAVDLDKAPYVSVKTSRSDEGWFLRTRPDKDTPDNYVIRETCHVGEVLVDVRGPTGWSGSKTFQLLLYENGAPRSQTVFDAVEFVGIGGSVPALSPTSTAWYPYQVCTEASSEELATNVTVAACLSDEHTVSQSLRVAKGTPGGLTLVGEFPYGSVRWDAIQHAMILESPRFSTAVAFSRPCKWLGMFPSWLDWLEGKSDHQATRGVWAILFDDVKAGDEIVVSARFTPESEVSQRTIDAASSAATTKGFAETLCKQKETWDRRLALVPQPMDFELHLLDYCNAIRTEDIRLMYYKAWAFLLSNIIPPLPEIDYPYPQLGCGKGSLWSEGHPKSRASAQFESFAAMVLLANVAPDPAWAALEGMMSLVDADGKMEGEGLPSKHCQAAWVLYSLTGDKARLREIYPAMKRFVLWKAEDPRWIYKTTDPPDQKYSAFVVAAMVDMQYSERIARALVMPEEVAFWKTKVREVANDYIRWFWGEKNGRAHCTFRESTGTRETPGAHWQNYALATVPGILPEDIRDRIVKALPGYFEGDKPLLGSCIAGYNGFTYAMQGFANEKLVDKLALMAEAAMRNVSWGREFAEGYAQSGWPQPGGVIPELSGAGTLIEGVLWHNGCTIVDGEPVIVHVPRAKGVRNLATRTGRVDFEFTGSGDQISISGKGLSSRVPPDGFKVSKRTDGTIVWTGELAVGKRIDLNKLATREPQKIKE